jgi:hypothetical protein
MTLKRMDNVGIVVESLDAAISLLHTLGIWYGTSARLARSTSPRSRFAGAPGPIGEPLTLTR